MVDRPGGAELLTAARSLLRDELLPLLPADRRYGALMAANAMAIAARDLELGERLARQDAAELAEFLGEPGPAP
ncbi:MAG: DUF6285 domain-containing protein, partial [Deferrisomatales bacterium]